GLLVGGREAVASHQVAQVPIHVYRERGDLEPLVGTLPPERPNGVAPLDRLVVRRQEYGVLGIEGGERVGVTVVGCRDIPADGRLDALPGTRFRGPARPGAPRQDPAGQEAAPAAERHACHSGVNLAILPVRPLQVCLAGLHDHPQPGFLWHADHAIEALFPPPVFAGHPAAPCSPTAIGSSSSTVRSAPIAGPRPLPRPSPWTTFVPAVGRPPMTARTIWS